MSNQSNGRIDVGDGHAVYWEARGRGRPALWLHGGPGSGINDAAWALFDQDAFRPVQFDQRGCGRSTPHASAPVVDLSTNTTAHLVSDIEALRERLGIDGWMVIGGSWGATLALAYAEAHPQRVAGLVLFSVTMSSPAEIDWITRGVAVFLPDTWEELCDACGTTSRVLDRCYSLLMDPDPSVHEPAARAWCAWEAAIVRLHGSPPPKRYDDPGFTLAFARLVTHYFANDAFLADGALRRDLPRIAHLPATLIHGRLDLGSPLRTAWDLHRSWPGSRLVIVDDAGHGTGFEGIRDAIGDALRTRAA